MRAGLAKAAIEEAGRSGWWTKIIGDFLGGAGESLPNWPADVLAEAVAQVHAAGGRVAVHAVCPEAVDAVVAAGVDSVEHGWAVTDAHFAAMCARNMAWVPTLMLVCCRRQVPCISRCMLAFKAASDTASSSWGLNMTNSDPAYAAGT
jgi:hypothetical protein